MFQSIIEKHKLQFFRVLWVNVKILHAFICSPFQKLKIRYSFVISWAILNNCTLFVFLIWNQEVSKQKVFLSTEFVIYLSLHTEAFYRYVVNGI